MATQVSLLLVPALMHSALGPQTSPVMPLVHGCPMPAGATHFPQRISPPSGLPSSAVQTPPEHCPPVTQDAPAASDPVTPSAQGPVLVSRTEQPFDLTAVTHASSALASRLIPGSASAA